MANVAPRPGYAGSGGERNSSLITGRSGGSSKKKYHWIDDDRVPSQAEIDWYASMDAGETPEITQEHLDEIGQGEGGEGLTVDDVGDGSDPAEEAEEMPGFTSEHNSYIDPETGEKKNQTREEWSASIGDDAISVGPTDTTENALAGGSLMASSVGGGYGKQRVAEQSRKQMNLTSGRKRSILTS